MNKIYFSLVILVVFSESLVGQVSFTTSPAPQGDTVFVCQNQSITYTVTDSIWDTWTFNGGSPSTSTANSVSVSYNTVGVFTTSLSGTSSGSGNSIIVRVGTPTPATFSPTQDTFCEQGFNPDLNPSVSPSGGSFSGPGMIGSVFHPAIAGPGTHTIVYSYTNSFGCVTNVSANLTVNPTPPTPNFQAMGSPTVFNGIETYRFCTTNNNQTFNLNFNLVNNSTYNFYELKLNGNIIDTGSQLPAGTYPLSLTAAGLYSLELVVYNQHGCVNSKLAYLFYGTNPSVGLGSPGSTIACLPSDGSGLTYKFPITSTGNNPPGTTYTLEVNDGSPLVTFNHPPPDTITHTFFQSSCGTNSVSFQNSYYVRITATNPCNSSVASVEPIVLSQPPESDIDLPDSACTNQPVEITNATQNGLIANNFPITGFPSGCDSATLSVWEITPSTYTLVGGSSLGLRFDPIDPANWFAGTNTIFVNFTAPGEYSIKLVSGNTSECSVDSITKTICIGDPPNDLEIELGFPQDSSFCKSFPLSFSDMGADSTGCMDNRWEWSIEPQTGWSLDSGGFDQKSIHLTFDEIETYTVSLLKINACDSATTDTTFNIIGQPFVVAPPSLDYCGPTRIDFWQDSIHRPAFFDSLSTLDYLWTVNPPTGWSFASGTSETDSFPIIDFQDPGVYWVTSAVFNACGVALDSQRIEIFELPVIEGFTDTTLCYDENFSYIPPTHSGLPPYSFEWFSSRGDSGTSESIVVNNVVAPMQITYIVVDDKGCSDTATFNLMVFPPLTSATTGNPFVCFDDSISVSVSASGGGGGYQYSWSPGLGLSDSTSANPMLFGNTSPGFYIVTITDVNLCTVTDTLEVSIIPLPPADAGNNISICPGDSVQIGNTTDSLLTYQWTSSPAGFSSQSPQPWVQPSTATTYYLTTTDTFGCTNNDSITLTIIPPPVADFDFLEDSICIPGAFFTDNLSPTGLNYQWFINNDPVSTLYNDSLFLSSAYSNDSVIQVKLIITAGTGCQDSIVKPLGIKPKPLVDFSIDSIICAGSTVSVTNLSSGNGLLNYHWSIEPNSIPISDPLSQNPTFTFFDSQNAPDSIYTITLVVNTDEGCIDSLQKSVVVKPRPLANFFLPPSSCSENSMSPTDSSNGNGLLYSWSSTPSTNVTIIDSNTSSPSFSFPVTTNDSVVYSIHLLVEDQNGCFDTMSKTYVVYPKPTAAYTPIDTSGCHPLSVSFQNLSTANQSGLDSLLSEWDFGNGQTSTLPSPSNIVFTNTGVVDSSYIVSLIVTNIFGCSDTLSDTVVVHPLPRAEVNVIDTVNCAPFVIDSTAISPVFYPNANATYTWLVLDVSGNILGTYAGPSAIQHNMPNDADTVIVRLVVTSPFGCENDSVETMFITIPDPVANFSLTPDSIGCHPLVVTVQDSSTPGVNHEWFINGLSQPTTDPEPTFTLNNLSNTQDSLVQITLVVTAGTGCTDTITRTALIKPQPLATFIIDSTVCANDTLQAFNSSVGVSPLSFTWTVSSPAVWIDDPMASDPFFGFPDNQSGVDSTYVITLFVTSNDGCVDTISRSVLVRSRPTADFDLPAALCGPTILQPIDQSLGGSLQYAWVITPDAGVVASDTTTATPSFGLPVSTNDTVAYALQLTVTDAFGCEDTITKAYVVYPTPTADFGLSIANGCHPLSVDFTDASSANYPPNDSLQYAWDFGNGQTSTLASPSNIVFTNTGVVDSSYIVSLIVTNIFGCSDTLSDTVVVHPLPRAEVNVIDTVNCAPFVIDSTVIAPVIYPEANATYTWLVLDLAGSVLQTYSGASAIQHIMPNDADTVIVRLVVTSLFGCTSDSVETTFITIPDPVANFSLMPDSIDCSPMQIAILDSSTPGVQYQWFINGVLQATTDPQPSFTLTNQSNTQDSLVEIRLVVTAGTGCTDTMSRMAVIHPQPLASFTADSVLCANDTLQITNLSQGVAPLSYSWLMSSSAMWINDPMAESPVFAFPDNQSGVDSTYTITLFVTSADGCIDTAVHSVLVRSRPTADFDLPAALCAPTILQPIDQSVGGALQYDWDIFPNAGVTLSGINTSSPSFDLPPSTSDTVLYSILLTVTDAHGCLDTITKDYIIYPTPTADFSASIFSGCHPLAIDFTDLSSSNYSQNDSLQYVWDFGNGQTSTLPSPSNIVFTNTGVVDSSYIVSLIVTNIFGCPDTLSDTVVVHPLPKAEYTSAVQGGCTPFVIDSSIVSATVFPLTNATYEWIFSTPNGTVLNSHTGLTGFSHTMILPEDTVVLSLVVTSLFNCENDTFSSIFVTDPNPIAQFSLSDTVSCTPLITQTSNTSLLATNYEWYVNGVLESTLQNPQFTLLNTGVADTTYSITLIAISANGCLDTLTQTVSVFPGPMPNFSSSSACLNEVTNFTDLTTGVRPVVQWRWSFGDGDSSSLQNPSHTYSLPGIYLVELSVTDSFGCEESVIDTVIVRPLPQADFSLDSSSCFTDTICVNQAKNFIDLSFVDSLGGNVNAWSWDIGNNGIIDYTTQNVSHTFLDTGQVAIRLVVSTVFGCLDTVVKSFFVVPDPVASFSLDTNQGCDGHQMLIANSSSGFIENYSWTLFTKGAGGSIQTIASHAGASPPVFPPLSSSATQDTVYYVSLLASSCCAQDSMVDSVVIHPTPTAFFIPSDTVGCSPLPITFLVDGQTVGNPDFIVFDFGDGSPPDTILPTTIVLPTGPVTGFGLINHVFNYSGPNNDTTYTITLTAVNACGSSTYSRSILVFPNTIFAFFTSSQTTGCAPMSVDFAGLTPNSTLTNWTFMYDTITGAWGTNTAQGSNVSFTYSTPGTYVVAMSVTDGCGRDTMYQQINVLPSPNAGFSFTNNVCEGDTVFFTNTSNVSPGVIMGYQWDFGNGQGSTVEHPFAVFDSSGVYQVCLIVFSDNGCPDTICQAVTISPRPSVAFDPVSICFNEQPVVFNNLSTISSGSITFTQWDFGDGSFSGNFNAQHTYSAPGTYTVKLIHQGSSGCADSVEQVIQIFETPTADFSITRPSGDSCGIPQTIQFTNMSSNDALDFFWDFDVLNRPDSLTSNLVNPSLTFTEYGRYMVRLIVSNGFGCIDTIDREVVIQPNPEALFAVDTLSGCQPFTVSFTDLSTFARPDLGGINRWIYHFGDGNVQDGANPNAIHIYSDTGMYFPYLVVITEYGCLDTFFLPQPIRVYQTPEANFNLVSYVEGVHSFQNLTIIGNQNISFRWDMGDGNSYFTRDVSHRYQIDRLSGDFTFDVCLYAETEFGCKDSICTSLFLPQLNLNVPNALAPDAVFGGEPSIFLPKGHSMIDYRFQVFDYWGNLIFETTELSSDGVPLIGWNGRRNNDGEILPKGIYVWKIFAMFEDGTIWPGVMRPNANRPITSGPINLIR